MSHCTCPKGHQWESMAAAPESTPRANPTCPVCGALAMDRTEPVSGTGTDSPTADDIVLLGQMPPPSPNDLEGTIVDPALAVPKRHEDSSRTEVLLPGTEPAQATDALSPTFFELPEEGSPALAPDQTVRDERGALADTGLTDTLFELPAVGEPITPIGRPSMSAQLRVVGGKDIGKVFALTEGQPLLVGRDMSTHTRLKDPHVAMLHCQVVLSGDGAVLTDRGSSGGVLVNGQRVAEYTLKPGDVFRVGDTKMCFEHK